MDDDMTLAQLRDDNLTLAQLHGASVDIEAQADIDTDIDELLAISNSSPIDLDVLTMYAEIEHIAARDMGI